MSNTEITDPSFNIRLLDRFYGVFALVNVIFLTIGVPFVFYRKVAAAVVIVIFLATVAIAWRTSRRGQPEKSLVLFSAVLWVLLVALLFGGLTPVSSAFVLAVAVMLSIVVRIQAGILFAASFVAAWLAYIVLSEMGLAPAPYFPGKPLVTWFIGAVSVWSVLLPIPQLVRKLRDALSLQRATLESTADGMLVVDNKGKVVAHNQRFADMWRIPPDLLATRHDQTLLGSVLDQLEDPQSFETRVRELYAHPEDSALDVIRLKDGRIFERYSIPQRLCARVVGRVWSFRDVTERARAEQRLRESEERFRTVADYTYDWEYWEGPGPRHELLYMSPSCERITGYALAEFMADPELLRRLIHPEDRHLMAAHLVDIADEEESTLDFRIVRRDGEICWIAHGCRAVYGEDGRGLGRRATNRDITQRKETEKALQESEERFRLIGTAAKDGIIILGSEDRVVYWNPAAETLFGYSAGEVLNREMHELIAPARFREDFRRGFAHFTASGEGPLLGKTFEIEALRKDGQEFPVELSISALQVKGSLHALGIVRDITERKRLETELQQFNQTLAQQVTAGVAKNLDQERLLVQQSRLAAMGEMIGNIAHQWRQPINALTLVLANLKDAYEYNELDKAYLDSEVAKGQKMIQGMSSTIDDFRNFFKPNKVKQRFRACDSVEEAIKLVSHSFKNHNIEIAVEETGECREVVGYPNEFAQVVLNALTNAKDAIVGKERGGSVSVRVDTGATSAIVSIRDNGGGIAEEIQGKVFDPYFTTKEKGTGIGLYMSKMIMDHMDGDITIHNVEGGAEVLLTLPLAGKSTV